MKRIAVYLTAVAAALVPAAVGLWGNASFAHGVGHAVARPAAASTSSAGADDGARLATGQGRHHAKKKVRHHAEPGDDRGTARGSHVEPGDDKGNHVEPGDDKGGHVEPGDDHGDRGGSDDDGHHGGGDDKGSGGHGSDD